jgi:hypothetical protein
MPVIVTEHASVHVCTSENCPSPGSYYVTCVDGPRYWNMSGPYSTHAAALADVDKALKIANEHDGRAWFMSWGTTRMADELKEPGMLQKHKLLEIAS